MIDFLLDCPIQTMLFVDVLQVKARFIKKKSDPSEIFAKNISYHFYMSQADAELDSNCQFVLSSFEKNKYFDLLNENIGEPVEQFQSHMCYHYRAILKKTDSAIEEDYFLVLKYKTDKLAISSNVGAFSFKQAKENLFFGPIGSLPSVIYDDFLILPFWYIQKTKRECSIESLFSFVNPKASLKKFIIRQKQESRDIENQWPDAENCLTARGTCYFEFNHENSDFSANIALKEEGGSQNKLFFGNSRYFHAGSKFSIENIEFDSEFLTFRGFFWDCKIGLLEIYLNYEETQDLIFSSYKRDNTEFVKWSYLEDSSYALSSSWSKKNYFEISIPLAVLRKNSELKGVHFYYDKEELFSQTDYNKNFILAVTDALRFFSLREQSKEILTSRFPQLEFSKDDVLFCFHNLSSTEGAPKVLFNVASRTSYENKHFISFNEGELGDLLSKDSKSFNLLDQYSVDKLNNESYSAAINSIIDILITTKPGLVVINSIDSFLVGDVAIRMGIPVAWVIHESISPLDTFLGHDNKIRHHYLRALKSVDLMIFVSEETKKVYSDFINIEKSIIIRNGIDVKGFLAEISSLDKERARSLLPLPVTSEELVFLSVGTTAYRKGQDRTLHELYLLSQKNPEIKWKFFIVGGRRIEFYNELIDLIKKYNFESRVAIIDETKDVYKYYKASDLYICNSRQESSPLVILEAMLSNLPIVSTNVFGLRELIQHEMNAIIFDPEKSGSLADSLTRIIHDDFLKERITNFAYQEVVENYNIDIMVSKYQEVFDKLLNKQS